MSGPSASAPLVKVLTPPIGDLESQIPQNASWNGRTVTEEEVPTSYDDTNEKVKKGGIGCCCMSLLMIVAGGIMWGAGESGGGTNVAGKTICSIGITSFACLCCSTIASVGAAVGNRLKQ